LTISDRKNAHVDAVVAGVTQSTAGNGFARWRLRHRALPELDLTDVDLSASLFGRRLQAPLIISSMTGGSERTGVINARLARTAESYGLALGLGSMRAALADPGLVPSFDVRPVAASTALFGNIGVVDVDVAALAALIRRLGLDGLFVHINSVQEAIQPEGSARFRAATDTIARIVAGAGVPVVVKEVGFGLSPDDVRTLVKLGVAGVDVAGSGGSNWALGEGWRDKHAGAVAAAFADWGWPTAEALSHAVQVRRTTGSEALIVASGGIGDGVTAVKALCLGADLVGMARPFLVGAAHSQEAATGAAAVLVDQMRIAAFACGAPTPQALDTTLLSDRTAQGRDEQW
jgi:isopentenyl-diphosphate delta-isomerase